MLCDILQASKAHHSLCSLEFCLRDRLLLPSATACLLIMPCPCAACRWPLQQTACCLPGTHCLHTGQQPKWACDMHLGQANSHKVQAPLQLRVVEVVAVVVEVEEVEVMAAVVVAVAVLAHLQQGRIRLLALQTARRY